MAKKAREVNLVRTVADLIVGLRDANDDDLKSLADQLNKFRHAWVGSGEGKDWPGAGTCCLSDVDVTDQVLEAVDIKRECFDA